MMVICSTSTWYLFAIFTGNFPWCKNVYLLWCEIVYSLTDDTQILGSDCILPFGRFADLRYWFDPASQPAVCPAQWQSILGQSNGQLSTVGLYQCVNLKCGFWSLYLLLCYISGKRIRHFPDRWHISTQGLSTHLLSSGRCSGICASKLFHNKTPDLGYHFPISRHLFSRLRESQKQICYSVLEL